ncbi:MAG: hypothetical protein ACJ790_05945 [Myxococcaceae bacterium]
MRILPVFLVLASALLLSSEADACSGPAGFSFDGLFPAAGDTDVPVNAHVFVRVTGERFDGGALSLGLFEVQGDGGSVQVSATVTQLALLPGSFEKGFELIPTASLAISSSFEVRESGQLLGTFTTTDQTDVTPPALAPVSIAEGVVNPPNSCWAGDEEELEVTYPSASSFTEPVRFEFRSEDGGQLLSSREDRGAFVFCAANYVGAYPFAGRPDRFELPSGTHSLEVSLIDRAGNRSQPTRVAYTASCDAGASTPPLSDAGDSGDAGSNATDDDAGNVEDSGADAGTSLRHDPAGCSLAGIGLVPAAVLAFALLRRQRRWGLR